MLLGHMNSHKSNNGLVDIPPKVLAYAEKHHPYYLEICTDWHDGFPIRTLAAFAPEVSDG